MAATSLAIHMAMTRGRGKCMPAQAAKACPVTMPSRADSAWNSMAMTLASSTTHSSM